MCGTRGPAVHHGGCSRPARCLRRQPEARPSAGTTTGPASLSIRRSRRRELRARTRTARRVAPRREKRPGRAPPSRSTAASVLASLTRLAGTDLPTGIGAARLPRARARARHGRCRSAPESSPTLVALAREAAAGRGAPAADDVHPTRPLPPAPPDPLTRRGRSGPPTTDIVCFTSGCCTQSCPRTRSCPRGWQPQGGHCVSGADDEHTKYVSDRTGALKAVCGQAQRTRGYPPRTVGMTVANLRDLSFTYQCGE